MNNLDYCTSVDFDSTEGSLEDEDVKGVNLLAQIYSDLVTARDVSPNTARHFDVKQTTTSTGTQEKKFSIRPGFKYIPRVVRVGEKPKERERYSGPSRAVRPHAVGGFPRHRNMTPKQREVIQEFETKTGVEILKHLPRGWTYVRPFTVPRGAEVEIKRLPHFLKTRVVSKLTEHLKHLKV